MLVLMFDCRFEISQLHVLRDRTSIYATVLMVRRHVNDQIQSMWIATDNALEFWEDRMEVVTKCELSRERNDCIKVSYLTKCELGMRQYGIM